MRKLAAFSVRARITAAVALIVALALTGAGAAVYVVELNRVDDRVGAEMTQELDEVRTFQREADDPETGQPFTDPDRMLEIFLVRNLPAQNEILFAFLGDGRTPFQGVDVGPLRRSAEFRRTVEELAPGTGGTRTIEVEDRRYVVAVLPVRSAGGQAEFVVTHNLTAARGELRDVISTYALVAALAFLLVTAVAWLLAGRLLAPVRRLRETTHQISEGDLSHRIVVSGNDDLTELTVTVNTMLDRLESSFEQQRRLLDDAGHELRTPLTVLRGHLELIDPADPSDVRSTRALLLDEIDRMSRLVDDLLLLAKSRRPDFVQPRPTDVAVLTGDVLAKCRALAPRRWTLDGTAEELVQLDPQRITQALLQLAHNAVRHTREGDEIAIGSRTAPGRLELWVRDTGTGVPDADRDRIFGRFARGADAVGDDGFGLGLSIVGAIADAHGGRVVLDDTVVGATFRVVVPHAVSLDPAVPAAPSRSTQRTPT